LMKKAQFDKRTLFILAAEWHGFERIMDDT
jgi:hypothetical protein